MTVYAELKDKIKKKKAVITIVGLGYVGLPIAMEFCRKGFKVNGLDTDKKRIAKLKNKTSYINDISDKDIAKLFALKKFTPTCDSKVLASSDVIIVCVPTPLRKTTEPDISYIIHASRSIRKYLSPGTLIIVESTTYPGTTRDVILPELEKSGFELDKDFYLAFSPERIDPGNKKYSFTNIPKIIGGMTKKATELGKLIYSHILNKVVGVSSCETAEVTKLLENTFRIVNIGLINEFAMLCQKLDIDVWEVIKTAKTKPFGFMPFYPGPGIGGHCIPADPMYLSWKARTVGFETEMIDIAAKINRMIPGHVVKRITGILRSKGLKVKSSKIFVIGVTYKKDVNDLREAPALEIIEKLEKKKVRVTYHDPYIPYLDIGGIKLKSTKLTAVAVKKASIVIIVSDHNGLDYKMIRDNAALILDTRNVFEEKGFKGDNIIKL